MNVPSIRIIFRLVAIGIGLNVLVTSATLAVVTSYTSSAAFFADLAANSLISSTQNFDSTAAGTAISDGGSVGGLTFNNFNFGSGTDMIVEDDFATTSGSNYLGVDFAANSFLIVGGDEFEITFASSFALGLKVISGETPNVSIFDNDVQLTAGGGTAFLDVSAVEQVLGGGDNVYFLGLIDPAAAFTSAAVGYDPGAVGAMTFNVDDITTATAAPTPVPMMGNHDFAILLAALLAAGVVAARRRMAPLPM